MFVGYIVYKISMKLAFWHNYKTIYIKLYIQGMEDKENLHHCSCLQEHYSFDLYMNLSGSWHVNLAFQAVRTIMQTWDIFAIMHTASVAFLVWATVLLYGNITKYHYNVTVGSIRYKGIAKLAYSLSSFSIVLDFAKARWFFEFNFGVAPQSLSGKD